MCKNIRVLMFDQNVICFVLPQLRNRLSILWIQGQNTCCNQFKTKHRLNVSHRESWFHNDILKLCRPSEHRYATCSVHPRLFGQVVQFCLWSWTTGLTNFKVRGSTVYIPQLLIGHCYNTLHWKEWQSMYKIINWTRSKHVEEVKDTKMFPQSIFFHLLPHLKASAICEPSIRNNVCLSQTMPFTHPLKMQFAATW